MKIAVFGSTGGNGRLILTEAMRRGHEVTEEDLRAYCAGKIAHFKVPRYIRLTDEFPMTVTGKIQKYKMREVSTTELGLEGAATPTA